jgi:hypothetical protein
MTWSRSGRLTRARPTASFRITGDYSRSQEKVAQFFLVYPQKAPVIF